MVFTIYLPLPEELEERVDLLGVALVQGEEGAAATPAARAGGAVGGGHALLLQTWRRCLTMIGMEWLPGTYSPGWWGCGLGTPAPSGRHGGGRDQGQDGEYNSGKRYLRH